MDDAVAVAARVAMANTSAPMRLSFTRFTGFPYGDRWYVKSAPAWGGLQQYSNPRELWIFCMSSN